MRDKYNLKSNPLVSVVIPTYNSEKTLSKCLSSIKSQTYSNIEIIVVDGGSRDRTIEIAKSFGAKVFILPGSGMADATNFGARRSRGKYIYRVDSDVILDPTLVEEAVQKCEIEGFDGVCIFWIPDESMGFWAKIRKIEKEIYIKHPEYVGGIKYNKPVLGARFLRREVFFAVGGMDDKVPLAGEDYAFYNKLGESPYKFALISAREKHIGEPRTLYDVFRKYFRYGKSLRMFLSRTEKGFRQVSPLRKYYVEVFKTALKKGPAIFLGLLIYQLTVYSATLLGLLFANFPKRGERK